MTVNIQVIYCKVLIFCLNMAILKANIPEMTAFYIKWAYLNYNDNKKIYYCDVFVVGQVTPMLILPEDIRNYVPLANEAKIVRHKYDVVSREFLDQVEC